MAIPNAQFKASIPKKAGGILEYYYEIAGNEEDFGVPTIAAPVVAALSGNVRFNITFRRKENGVMVDLEQTLTIPGEPTDFDEPTVAGPVMVVQDPPKFTFAPEPEEDDDPASAIDWAA